MKKYDVIVIGSGGGAKITSPAARLGLKVACIEKDKLGGTCLNRGCIPSKMLIHPADVAHEIQGARRFDIQNDPSYSVNFERLISRISATVDQDSNNIAAGYTKNPNIDYYKGTAKFQSNTIIEINGEQITADKIFIGVGARPHIPDIPGLQNTPFMTSTEALRNTKLPKKMVVVGGGYIGVEIGYAYAALGCDVHFLVRSKFLRDEDDDVIDEFTKVFSSTHNVHMKCVPTKVEYQNNVFKVHYEDNSVESCEQSTDDSLSWDDDEDSNIKTIEADALLIATGVSSNADTLNLSATDIETFGKNFIKTNDYLETSVPNIYALGDCIGKYQFRHSVNFEGEYLFNQVFKGEEKKEIQYPPIPHAVFTNPQIAGVGLTERECIAQKIDYIIGMNAYKSSAMGMALLSEHGFCKILIEQNSRKILGAHIIGPEASNMIHMIIAFMNKNGTLDDLLNMVYIHPALPEIVRNAARKADKAYSS